MRYTLALAGLLVSFISNAFCEELKQSDANTGIRFVNTADPDVRLGEIRKAEVNNYDGTYRPSFETSRLTYSLSNKSNSDYFIAAGVSNERKPTVGVTLGISW